MKAVFNRTQRQQAKATPAITFTLPFALLCLGSDLALGDNQQNEMKLANDTIGLSWQKQSGEWRLSDLTVTTPKADSLLHAPSGEYTILFSEKAPSTKPVATYWAGGKTFPEPPYRYITPKWNDATTPVAMNTAGTAEHFFPNHAEKQADGSIVFRHQSPSASIESTWQLDGEHPGDIKVQVKLTAKRDGYFSVASPTLAHLEKKQLSWGTLPGVFAGNSFNKDVPAALAYGHGLPDKPIVVRNRGVSTLAPMLTDNNGFTVAAIADPKIAPDPWPKDKSLRNEWRLGLSHMNRRGQLTATLYQPVLGQHDSKFKKGESRTLIFRYSLKKANWFEMLSHVAYDVYHLTEFLNLKAASRSLTERVRMMYNYVTDTKKSLWRVETFRKQQIGAQSYLGGVLGSEKDAMKNSDYGAMWMLAKQTQNPKLVRDRLPHARNFKLEQQNTDEGFFEGAARGQYYLYKSKKFVEEWGAYVEPVASTYYILSDLGNIALFDPSDKEVRKRIRLGADKLLDWMKPDGSWPVAFDEKTKSEMFTDLGDRRPTFYGLLIAHKILGDQKYLDGATKAADWIIENAVKPLQFVGVCGDSRFAPDFATAQIAQALLEIYDITGDTKYKDAGVRTTQFYASAVFTHPLATSTKKSYQETQLVDWQLNQMGLSFEHGGTIGSATTHGPILLASHAGLFIRVHQMTGDPLLRDLARAGALARSSAFANPSSGVASYYWFKMNNGPGNYPHHAWWQIGWITDYLISEASLRSNDKITFPRGFFTPKVGPHAAYGFAPGKIYGKPAVLAWGDANLEQADVDCLFAKSEDNSTHFVILLNASAKPIDARISPSALEFNNRKTTPWLSATCITANGKLSPLSIVNKQWKIHLPAYGIAVIELSETKPSP